MQLLHLLHQLFVLWHTTSSPIVSTQPFVFSLFQIQVSLGRGSGSVLDLHLMFLVMKCGLNFSSSDLLVCLVHLFWGIVAPVLHLFILGLLLPVLIQLVVCLSWPVSPVSLALPASPTQLASGSSAAHTVSPTCPALPALQVCPACCVSFAITAQRSLTTRPSWTTSRICSAQPALPAHQLILLLLVASAGLLLNCLGPPHLHAIVWGLLPDIAGLFL